MDKRSYGGIEAAAVLLKVFGCLQALVAVAAAWFAAPGFMAAVGIIFIGLSMGTLSWTAGEVLYLFVNMAKDAEATRENVEKLTATAEGIMEGTEDAVRNLERLASAVPEPK